MDTLGITPDQVKEFLGVVQEAWGYLFNGLVKNCIFWGIVDVIIGLMFLTVVVVVSWRAVLIWQDRGWAQVEDHREPGEGFALPFLIMPCLVFAVTFLVDGLWRLCVPEIAILKDFFHLIP